MRLLLDTHAFLWAVMQPAKLSPKARRLLENPANDLMVSAASAWETATKFRLGKLPGAKAVLDDFDDVARRLSAGILPISHFHALLAGSYPQSHRDPFDRILAAQAETEGVPLVSRDRALCQFGVELLW
ncbi:MAG: twitching motility protein PilT [Lysobacterales bacterium 66-474]|nr:MAG: twitching motility protein PilT [Rhodanobacter sp. SCN 66-43]OJY86545.1 MAG: twitching motility protein PilT [Xanthomonadales bacterium 66-474]